MKILKITKKIELDLFKKNPAKGRRQSVQGLPFIDTKWFKIHKTELRKADSENLLVNDEVFVSVDTQKKV